MPRNTRSSGVVTNRNHRLLCHVMLEGLQLSQNIIHTHHFSRTLWLLDLLQDLLVNALLTKLRHLLIRNLFSLTISIIVCQSNQFLCNLEYLIPCI